jgi:hypothetical protein
MVPVRAKIRRKAAPIAGRKDTSRCTAENPPSRW